MYIPVMAFVTYILLSTILAGLRGSFKPELLGSITSTALAVVLFEIVVLKVAMYILNISNDSQLLDLVAYSGYKFVGIIVTLVASEILSRGAGTTGWIGWTVFLYTFLANAFFLVSFSPLASEYPLTQALKRPILTPLVHLLLSTKLRSLKYVLLPDASNDPTFRAGSSYTIARAQRNRRTQFLFVYAYVIQLFFMWVLSREEAAATTVATKMAAASM
jgi:protein transport protein YIF1